MEISASGVSLNFAEHRSAFAFICYCAGCGLKVEGAWTAAADAAVR
jgi:hypothetical protein